MAATDEAGPSIDGRTARAVRTHDAIVDACLDLVDEGDLRPTGPRIAERAGVSVRSIFQHFADLDALFAAVGDKVRRRIADHVDPIDRDGPLDERIRALVAQRSEVFEMITPVLRAAIVHAAASDVIKQTFDHSHRLFEAQVREVFAGELATADDPQVLTDALVVALGWATWETLRASQGRSAEEATGQVEWMVRAALGAATLGG